jgi:hypothetical protein
MTLEESKTALDKIIQKARVHFYKPIQIAEILHRDRVNQDIDLITIDTYRNTSKVWRDIITERFVGRSSSSSAEYQEALFTKAGLRRSIDKVYEIIVYSLFSVLVEALEVTIAISINENKLALLQEFADFAEMVIGLTPDKYLLIC